MSLPCSSLKNCIVEFTDMTDNGDAERMELSVSYDVSDESLETSIETAEASPSLSTSLSQSMTGYLSES